MKDKRWLKKDPTAWMRSRIFDTNDNLEKYIKLLKGLKTEVKKIECPTCSGDLFFPKKSKDKADFKCINCLTTITIPPEDWHLYGIKTKQG